MLHDDQTMLDISAKEVWNIAIHPMHELYTGFAKGTHIKFDPFFQTL